MRCARLLRVRAGAVGLLLIALSACPAHGPVRVGSRSAFSPSASATPAARTPEGDQPLVFVVHPTRAAPALDLATARALLAGRIANWGSLGAQPRPLRLVLGPAGVAQAKRWNLDPGGARLVPSEQGAADAVAQDTGAIALVSSDALSPSVRALSLGGVDAVRDPDRYPLRTEGTRSAGPVITVMAVGDIITARTVDKIMVQLGDFVAPFRRVASRLAAADLAFGDFESPISARYQPLHGRVMQFVSRPQVLQGLKSAGIDELSLANNHSGDYGGAALLETIRTLRGAGIATSGAGANDAEAHRPAVVVRGGVRFAFLSFNAIIGSAPATASHAGVATVRMRPWYPFEAADLDRMIGDVRRARAVADIVIVVPHWGQEYVAVPNDDQRRVAHALVEAGADMVIGSHPHWVQGAEIWKGHLIAYSLGNFVFDQTWSTETQQGAALDMTFWGSRLVAASFVPVQIEDWYRPRFLDERTGATILRRIWSASGEPYRRAA